MEKGVNDTPLNAENQSLFDQYWRWFATHRVTNKDAPYVVSEGAFYHLKGRIGINEEHEDPAFPIGAAMVEEILHYAAWSDSEESSADYSPEFLEFIFQQVVATLGKMDEKGKRAFQSQLIRQLWTVIDRDTKCEAI